MEHETIHGFLIACRDAQRITDMLPELPFGMTTRDMNVIDAINRLERRGGPVRVSDVSEQLHVTRPGITKAIAGLERNGCVSKTPQEGDGRVVLVALTDKGRAAHEVYVNDFYDYLAELFADIDEEDFETTARTVERARLAMLEAGPELQEAVNVRLEDGERTDEQIEDGTLPEGASMAPADATASEPAAASSAAASPSAACEPAAESPGPASGPGPVAAPTPGPAAVPGPVAGPGSAAAPGPAADPKANPRPQAESTSPKEAKL